VFAQVDAKTKKARPAAAAAAANLAAGTTDELDDYKRRVEIVAMLLDLNAEATTLDPSVKKLLPADARLYGGLGGLECDRNMHKKAKNAIARQGKKLKDAREARAHASAGATAAGATAASTDNVPPTPTPQPGLSRGVDKSAQAKARLQTITSISSPGVCQILEYQEGGNKCLSVLLSPQHCLPTSITVSFDCSFWLTVLHQDPGTDGSGWHLVALKSERAAVVIIDDMLAHVRMGWQRSSLVNTCHTRPCACNLAHRSRARRGASQARTWVEECPIGIATPRWSLQRADPGWRQPQPRAATCKASCGWHSGGGGRTSHVAGPRG
jgi:hypothetical protein